MAENWCVRILNEFNRGADLKSTLIILVPLVLKYYTSGIKIARLVDKVKFKSEIVQIDRCHYNSVITRIISGAVPGASRLARLQELSKKARQRVKWFDYYNCHNHNARLTCRHFEKGTTQFHFSLLEVWVELSLRGTPFH